MAREVPYRVLWEQAKPMICIWVGGRKGNNGGLLLRSFAKEMSVRKDKEECVGQCQEEHFSWKGRHQVEEGGCAVQSGQAYPLRIKWGSP